MRSAQSRVHNVQDVDDRWPGGSQPQRSEHRYPDKPRPIGDPPHQERVDRVLGFDLELFNAGMNGDITSTSNPWAKVRPTSKPDSSGSNPTSTSTSIPIPITSMDSARWSSGTRALNHSLAFSAHEVIDDDPRNGAGPYSSGDGLCSTIINGQKTVTGSEGTERIEGIDTNTIWDVMGGGREDELDFDAFLKSFGGDEYTA